MTTHDPTRGDLCPCKRCDAERLARLAASRAWSARQQAARHPRSQRKRDAAKAATRECNAAVRAAIAAGSTSHVMGIDEDTGEAKFQTTYCSQCGQEFGAGDHGYSHCDNHQ